MVLHRPSQFGLIFTGPSDAEIMTFKGEVVRMCSSSSLIVRAARWLWASLAGHGLLIQWRVLDSVVRILIRP